MKKTFLILTLASLTFVLAGCSLTSAPTATLNANIATVDVNEPVVPAPGYEGWQTFTNPTGGYSFKYPAAWKAAVNQYNAKNSLFGIDANGQAGLGGVEVSSFTGTPDEYLGYMQDNVAINYLSRDNITVNGIPAIRTKYQGSPVVGNSVILKKGDEVINVYVNSATESDIDLFGKLVDSFIIVK
ncbi:MAG: hypothetical protein WC310_04280 [Patescibacteria group bacterium]|jgi:hypothetical protein